MIDRRGFLSSFAGIAALTARPLPDVCQGVLAHSSDKLPDRSLDDTNEEAYWTEIRKLFLIPEDQVYLTLSLLALVFFSSATSPPSQAWFFP